MSFCVVNIHKLELVDSANIAANVSIKVLTIMVFYLHLTILTSSILRISILTIYLYVCDIDRDCKAYQRGRVQGITQYKNGV